MSDEKNKQPSAFDKLLGELDTMTKALPAGDMDGDKKIALADEGDDSDKKKEGDGDNTMTKSMKVTLPDGTVVDAEDGTALVKSLLARVEDTEDVMAKALGSAIGLIKAQGEALAKNNDLVKSLQQKVADLSNEGKGRKTLVNIHENASAVLTKAETPGMTGVEFMAKANAAHTAGKISGKDLTVIDVSLRSQQPVDPALIQKVLT